MHKVKLIKNLIQTIIFILALFYLYFNVNYEELIHLINFNKKFLHLILIYIFIGFLTNFFQVKRWKLLIEYFNEKAKFSNYFKIITYSNLLSEISFFGIFSRTMIKFYSEIKVVNVIITLFVEKVLSIYTLVILSELSLVFLIKNEVFPFFSEFIFYLYVLIILTIIFPYILIKIKKFKFFNHLRKNKYFINSLYFLNKKYFYLLLLNTVLIQFFAIINIYIVSQMFNFKIDLLLIIMILPVINFFVAIPASITPWGWRELVFINILSFIGLSSEQSLIISLTNSILIISMQFLFYLICLLFTKN